MPMRTDEPTFLFEHVNDISTLPGRTPSNKQIKKKGSDPLATNDDLSEPDLSRDCASLCPTISDAVDQLSFQILTRTLRHRKRDELQ